MKLIKATLSDLDVLTTMNIQLRAAERLIKKPEEHLRKRMRSFLEGNVYRAYLAKNGETICGYALVNIKENPIWLRHLFVRKECRRTGVGSRMIDRLMDELKIKEMDIEVMVWNEKAIHFYEKYGFKKRYVGMRYKRSLGTELDGEV